MISKKTWLLGCGAAALVALLGLALVVGFVVYASQDVSDAGVLVDCPTEVALDQSFELRVTVTNERPHDVLLVEDVDVEEDYLSGFTVKSVDPAPKASSHTVFDGGRSWTFRTRISPHDSKVFTFTMQARKTGRYRGNVSVWEGLHSIEGAAETTVKSEGKGTTVSKRVKRHPEDSQ